MTSGSRPKHYLVGLNGGNLLVEFNVVADLLVPLLQGSLGDGLGHLRHLDASLGIGAYSGHKNGQRKLGLKRPVDGLAQDARSREKAP